MDEQLLVLIYIYFQKQYVVKTHLLYSKIICEPLIENLQPDRKDVLAFVLLLLVTITRQSQMCVHE